MHWNDLILRAFPRVGRGLRDISRKPGFQLVAGF
jgi:hypothetical protein